MTAINALRDMMHDTIRQLMTQQRDLIRQIMVDQRATTLDMAQVMIGLIREQITEGKSETRQALRAVEADKQDLLAALTKRPSRKTTAALPQPGTTIDRIYRHLVEVKRPQRADQVERDLNLPGPTSRTRRTLDTLVQRRLADRPRPGLYQALAPTGGLPDDTGPHLTTLERVYQTIRDAEEPLPPRDIQRRLGMTRDVSAEISKLRRQGRIERIDEQGGLLSARYRVAKKG
jgi:predicted DNA-binding transcriptional regulator